MFVITMIVARWIEKRLMPGYNDVFHRQYASFLGIDPTGDISDIEARLHKHLANPPQCKPRE